LIYRGGDAGEKSQVSSFRCKVTETGDRYQTAYYSAQGRKFKSVNEVSKFLSLSDDKSSVATTQKGKASLAKKGRPKNGRDLENERKKLKRELDKLIKNHEKASKALDDFQNDQSNDQSQIDDDVIPFDPKKNKALWAVLSKPEIDSFPGLPASCTQEVLAAWDFLCTFNRSLSLHPIALDEFAASLIYKPTNRDEAGTPPLFLTETHLALLKLLLNDVSSDSWWWSTLETSESEAKEEIVKGEADHIAPTIKVDFAGLIDHNEDPVVTRKWLQALEDIRTRRANAGGAIKAVIKSAAFLTTNPIVKSYLKRAMRGWKSGDATFAKQSVMWLIGRVREARPDLWGRNVEPEALKENKAKIAREAANAMEVLEDVMEENVEDIHYGDSDAEESDSEDDENDIEADEDFNQNIQDSNRIASDDKEDLTAPVTTHIPNKPPPFMVDLLLPPYKPLFNSHLVSPFTWSFMVGASVSRILHRYKRLRNEVDDNLREFRELKPLTVGERRKREKLAAFRVLSECIAEAENGQECPVESAVEHLCSGKDYLSLSALQRLCILRILIEAAYDTHHINQCIQDNINASTTAIKQLENEERRAKKEAKEEAGKVEMAARERLAKDSRDEFVSKKKREIIRKNKYTGEFTNDHLESLTEDDIASFDEETAAEFDALPEAKQFSKNEVRTMVSKINDEAAFNTTELEALTLEEIENRENNTLVEMEEELAGYGNPESVYSRDISAKIDSMKRQIHNFKEWQESLPASRAEAAEALKDAIEDGTIKPLRNAIKVAKLSLLSGDDEDTGGKWTLDLLRDAALELKHAEKRKRVTEAQKELIAKRNKCFVRTAVVGMDRAYNKYWHFEHEHDIGGGVWYDANFKILSEGDENIDDATPQMNAAHIAIGARDEEDDLRGTHDKTFIKFSRQEYHPSGAVNTLVRRHNGCISSSKSLRGLIKNLDSKGLREGSLKTSMKEILEASGYVDTHANEVEDADAVEAVGDDEHFLHAKTMAASNPEDFGAVQNLDLIISLQSAIGQRCRLRRVADEISAPDSAIYSMGTVTGWRMKTTVKEYHNPGTEELTIVEKEEVVWSIAFDHGRGEEISAVELLNGLIRAKKWKHQYPGYVEHDSPLFSYRNKVGRFCGRAVDAPYAASNLFFSKLMLKREQEYYASLKSRTYENNWGGKSGLRNNWIATLKESFDDISILRDALLTLEDAFNELCGQPVEQDEKTNNSTAKELLENENLRCDVELESIGLKISGLWHCYDSRAVFREIISRSSSLGIFALGLDLIFRNCQAYLDATKPTVTRKSSASASNFTSNYDQSLYATSSGRLTRSAYSTGADTQQTTNSRRQNSWQQQQSDY
jgi:hypothetical protein